MKKVEICPSVLSANFANLERDVECLKKAGIKTLHVDVMDGHFVPNISFGAGVLKSLCSCCDMKMDVHLMVTNPLNFLQQFFDAGASSLTFHVESSGDILKCIEKTKDLGCSCGLALSPKTSFEVVEPYVNFLDSILVMTVEPGFSGQAFIPQMLSKIKKIRSFGLEFNLEVDGGINEKNALEVLEAGANSLVVGSFVFNSGSIEGAISKLKKIFLQRQIEV